MPVSDEEFSKGSVDFHSKLRPAIIEDLEPRSGGYTPEEILGHLCPSRYEPDDENLYPAITALRNDEQWMDLGREQLDVLEVVLEKMFEDKNLEREEIKIGGLKKTSMKFFSSSEGEVEREYEVGGQTQLFYRHPSKPAVLRNSASG